MKPKSKFIITGNKWKQSILAVVEFDDEYFIYEPKFMKKNDTVFYDTKEDAMYHKLILELQKGKSLENFKTSPYYEDYLARLKIKNPEYLI